jgi:hypothetical protein
MWYISHIYILYASLYLSAKFTGINIIFSNLKLLGNFERIYEFVLNILDRIPASISDSYNGASQYFYPTVKKKPKTLIGHRTFSHGRKDNTNSKNIIQKMGTNPCRPTCTSTRLDLASKKIHNNFFMSILIWFSHI